jgi:phosphoglycerol transferase MdoB-like AlkP superfamily enzyme
LNELAGNGWYSFAQAALTREFEYAPFYKTAELDESYQRVRQLVAQTNTTFLDDRAILRAVDGDPKKPRLNVVLLLEESLGSEFFGCLGRQRPTCTPNLDKLSSEGLLFTNLYASGNRTVRGMEGVLCSFPPLPGDSVVVRSGGKQMETLARVLKRDGYTNTFIYAGRGAFDHLRSFMLGNGYDRFIEQSDFANPQFSTIWGVCNEDLYRRGLEECRKADQTGSPFLLTMLSVSNHKPFTYPEGRISANPNKRKRDNAVKYTDYAIGRFLEAAKQERFWTNTVFVVVADHGARVYGRQTIPMKSYEIPFLVLGPAAVSEPARIGTLGGQVDVAPTVLGLIGRPYVSAFFGRDLFQIDPATGRSILNHNRDIGLFENNELVVLGLNKSVEYYEGNPKEVMLASTTSSTANKVTEEDAVALFQVANDIYVHDEFRQYREIAKRAQKSSLLATKRDGD